MTKADIYFKNLCERIFEENNTTEGEKVRPLYKDGTPSHTLFVNQVFEEYNISKGEFPFITFRPTALLPSIQEMFCIYQRPTNNLDEMEKEFGIKWWRPWDIGDGTIGQRYGATVKKYDLMNKLLKGLEEMPYGRRHIINLYQYADFDETSGLHPCAMETHWAVRGNFLDMTLIQRSSDVAVANCINKVQYTALMMMVARHVGLTPGKFCHYVHNAHIYDRHVLNVKEMLLRDVQSITSKPQIILNPDKKDFYSFRIEDFKVVDYKSAGKSPKFELAI